MSITKSLTEIRMRALNEARDKFRYRSVWKADKKIMYKVMAMQVAKFILTDIVASSSWVTEKAEIVFHFDVIILFLFVLVIFEETF